MSRHAGREDIGCRPGLHWWLVFKRVTFTLQSMVSESEACLSMPCLAKIKRYHFPFVAILLCS